MKNITKDIQEATSKEILWSIDIFPIILDELKKSKYKISYWEDEENWATIFNGDTIIAYLWKKYPLIFIDSANENDLRKSLKEHEFITFIIVNSLTDKALQINYNELKDYFDYGLTYKKFSAEDLWFHSNSI